MITLPRLKLFVSRYLMARRYGIEYRGTTVSEYPTKVKLNNRYISIGEPLGDDCIYDFWNVLLDDEYGLSKVEGPVDTIVDIGVNMGIFLLAAWHHYPNSQLFGYEPNPLAFERARSNTAEISSSIFNEAVGSVQGMCRISDHLQSRLTATDVCEDGEITMTAFSEVVHRAGGHVDLLKMDCEGAEWDILLDNKSLKQVREIRMEYHLFEDKKIECLFSLLSAAGHRVVKIVDHGNHGIVWSRFDG